MIRIPFFFICFCNNSLIVFLFVIILFFCCCYMLYCQLVVWSFIFFFFCFLRFFCLFFLTIVIWKTQLLIVVFAIVWLFETKHGFVMLDCLNSFGVIVVAIIFFVLASFFLVIIVLNCFVLSCFCCLVFWFGSQKKRFRLSFYMFLDGFVSINNQAMFEIKSRVRLAVIVMFFFHLIIFDKTISLTCIISLK